MIRSIMEWNLTEYCAIINHPEENKYDSFIVILNDKAMRT